MANYGGTKDYSGGAMGRKGGPSVPVIAAPSRMQVPGTGPQLTAVQAFAEGIAQAVEHRPRSMGDYVNRGKEMLHNGEAYIK